MSIASEINNYRNGLGDAYDAVDDMGGIIPQDRNMNNLDTAIRTIPQSQGGTYTAGNGIDIDANNEISVDTTVIQEKLTAGTGINISAQNVISATGAGKPILYVGFEINDPGKLYLYKDESLTTPATGQDLLDGLEAGNNVVGYDDGGGLCYLTISLGFEGDGDYRLFRINGMYALTTWDYAYVSTDAYTITSDDFIGVANQNYLTVSEAFYNAQHIEFLWSEQLGVPSLRLYTNQSSEVLFTRVLSAVDDGVAVVDDSVDGGTYHLVYGGGTRFIGVKSGTNGDTMKFIVFEYRSASTPKWYKTETTLQNVLTAGSNITIDNSDPNAPVISATGGSSAPVFYTDKSFLPGPTTNNCVFYKDQSLTTTATFQDMYDAAKTTGLTIACDDNSGNLDYFQVIFAGYEDSDSVYFIQMVDGAGDTFQFDSYSMSTTTFTVSLNQFQEKLTAGTGISLSSNTISAPAMTGATSSGAGSAGIVPAPAAGDEEKVLHGDGTWKDTTAKLVEMSYGEANAWTKFINAYNAGSIVYCRASSNANPASGSQTRKAFMAYVNNATTPTSVEFQYVRSVSSKTEAQPVDQVFVYTLTNTNGGTWSVASRNMGPKIAAGTGINVSYSNGTYTISLA